MKLRFVKEVSPTGRVIYYTEQQSYSGWAYITNSLSSEEEEARKKFEYIKSNGNCDVIIAILEEFES